MSFRRDSEPQRKFTEWKRLHSALIIKSGIPDVVIRTEQDWIYFLNHGDTPDSSYDSRADPRLLADRDRALALRELIISYHVAYFGSETSSQSVLPPSAFPWLYEARPPEAAED